MRASFDEIAGKGVARRDELYPLIASLIRAERTHRQARSISLSHRRRQVSRSLKDPRQSSSSPTRRSMRARLRELATRRLPRRQAQTGSSSAETGHRQNPSVHRHRLGGHPCPRPGGRFFNLVDLVNQLEQEKAAGRSRPLGREAAALRSHRHRRTRLSAVSASPAASCCST